jgi:predicted small lipoprotein YifL
MRRVIVAFMVVAGMALAMAGCGGEENAPKGKAATPESTAPAPAPTPTK